MELKGAQVRRPLSWTYLLKSCTDYIRPHEENICKSIVNLLVTCPDAVSIRKELLIALKHVLSTDFKQGLFPLIDTLLDERVLIGTGRSKASGVLKSGVHCLALFKEKDEEREMLQCFSQILVIMEARDLVDMFSLCMPELFECMIANTQLLHIFSTLLQAQKVLRPFTDVLVNYLVSNKLDTLKQPDTPAAKLVLQLFRFVFVAVAKAPTECERVLQPHVHVIMDVCMKSATEVDRPLGYMHLLRNMFRSLNGAKFDNLLRI
ncbi:hypothetical protein J5N97_012759 [Dioscorea zingiberensis]|uniref:Uncharacterized protein n=1 Tax=Dioscorea zingiberensis TaxID=325984 RepID=A0A9D5CPM3_9LILI|nr:hypothetical protein J5N97_012759 [Dioscorea zingiberensis]